MSEAIQQCIDKLKATGAHVSSEEAAVNTGNDATSNSDPQIGVLEPSEVCMCGIF